MESPGRKSRCEAMRGKKCSGRWSPKCYCTDAKGAKGPHVPAAAAAPKASKHLSTLATILANLPDVYEKNIDYEMSEKKIARRLYGSKLKRLTPKVISKWPELLWSLRTILECC